MTMQETTETQRTETPASVSGDAHPLDLGTLYERFKWPLHSYIYRVLGSREDADDLTQEVFLRAHVVYHSRTGLTADGTAYQIATYHDLGTGRMHVETVMDDRLDVVAVGEEHVMLGKDMRHHVAQWGAAAWPVDDSAFDLAQLRQALQTRSAVSLGTGRFQGQEVYRIRYHSGLVLLLDMKYKPVNLLRGVDGPGIGEPNYEVFKLMPVSQVPASMWDMRILVGFHLGTLPQKP